MKAKKSSLPPVLDVCCGGRSMWFESDDSRALYMDIRHATYEVDKGTDGTKGRNPIVVDPDVQADFTNIPFPDSSFHHVVFDPPHYTAGRLGRTGNMFHRYGSLLPGWEEMLRAGFAECFRVLKPCGTLIFKWCSIQIPLSRVLALTPAKPLYGHRTGKQARTHWVAFMKVHKDSGVGE